MTRRRLREIAFLVAVGSAIVAGFACGLCGCAAETGVTLSERPTRPFEVTRENMAEVWFADGGPTVLTARNNTAAPARAHVVCRPSVPPSYIDYGHHECWACLAPGQEKRRLVEFMNVDALRRPVCAVADVEPAPAGCEDSCFEERP